MADPYYGLGLSQQAQYAAQLSQYQSIIGVGQAPTPLVLNTIKPMPVGPKINDLLLLVEEELS